MAGHVIEFYEKFRFPGMDEEADENILNFIRRNPVEAYELLKCRKCTDFCHPPFSSCKDEHLICAYCMDEDEQICEQCGASNLDSRPWKLERLHVFLDFNCVYKKYGCEYQGIGHRIIDHINKCSFMIQACPHQKCDWIGKPADLFGHYEEEHPNNFFKDHVAEVNFDSLKRYFVNAFVIQLSKYEFIYLELIFNDIENSVQVIVHNLGYLRLVERLQLQLKIHRKSGGTFDIVRNLSNHPNYLQHDMKGIAVHEMKLDSFVMSDFVRSPKPNMVFSMNINIKRPLQS